MAMNEHSGRDPCDTKGRGIQATKCRQDSAPKLNLLHDNRVEAVADEEQWKHRAKSPLIQQPFVRLVLPVVIVCGRLVRISPPHVSRPLFDNCYSTALQ